ncbi:MAG: PRC-barrel domain-containing protein, partial [Deltaproteobacteria bacterium]|nr:PRC-barrel domain-containing protein [Deltaproteobacteria bacterium]
LYMAEQEGWYAGIPAAMFVEHEAIPAGGFAVHRGAKVFAKDERVGKVDEFLVEGKSGRITHLVLVEGHLWGKKDIAVPVNQIDRYEDGDVYLKIDKAQVESLPEFDVKKHD